MVLLGPKAIQAGSLHCDLWRGRAIDLALHDEIAMYPVTGWWKTHTGQRRVGDKGRYALVISLSARLKLQFLNAVKGMEFYSAFANGVVRA